MSRFLTLTGLLVLVFSSCNSEKSGDDNGNNKPVKDTVAIDIDDFDDPRQLRRLDSIPLPEVKDTTGMDETGKDSLIFSRLFQKEANRLGRAEMQKNYEVLADFAPEGVIKRFGGRAKYIERLKAVDENREPYIKILNGPVKRVAPAVDDDGFSSAWYCLMPVRAYRMADNREVVDVMWLGGQADVTGKKVNFLNITSLSREQIMQVMPDLRFVLDAEAGQK